ncbi:MAG TPA: hypothetical protein VLD37_03460 [Candidatus Bilamarchaeum sp.]|nr:hypothetical protein [Candidatus Bilamarchaeum sp.]
MNKPVTTKSSGTITMRDIRDHLARYGREMPNVLPMTSGIEESPAKEPEPAPAAKKDEERAASPGLGPLNLRGLHQALIHNPRDVNSPY